MIDFNRIPDQFYWYNQPKYEVVADKLVVTTVPGTDFWQRTHYGFNKDNGHCLLTKIKNDFLMEVKTSFSPNKQYDQCGLMVRIDQDNWIKTSVEFESPGHSLLGSVVTNNGFSDWAMIDINQSINEMWFRIQSRGKDFLIEYSHNGNVWHQQRITHLHKDFTDLDIGIYACSPMDSSFVSEFENLRIVERNI